MCTASAQFLWSCELVVKGCLRRVTPQIIASAADWNNRRNGAYGVYGIKAVRTTFAGFILLAASNALLILSLGTEQPTRPQPQSQQGLVLLVCKAPELWEVHQHLLRVAMVRLLCELITHRPH